MSSYIIAGSSQNIDTAYCQQVANKIKAKYSNIDFRIIIKHPTEWDAHIQQVCRIYGFPRKQNPIIYTFDGKMIGDKHAFLTTCRKYFGISEKEMGIGVVSTDVNKKIAEQELNKKLKIQRGEKTMAEVIDQKLQERLNNKIFSYRLPDYQKKIEKGLVFFIKQVEGMVDSIKFEVQKVKEVKNEEIKEEEIDLVAITQNDQIPTVEQHRSGNHSEKEKDPFLTHQQEEDRRSRTGSQRLQESMHSKSHISHEGGGLKRSSMVKDSKQRSNSIRPQATQPVKLQFELENIEKYIVSDLEDDYYLIFNNKPIVLGSLKITKCAPTQNGLFEMNYEKYPRKVVGHLYSDEPRIIVEPNYINKQEDALSQHQDDNKERQVQEKQDQSKDKQLEKQQDSPSNQSPKKQQEEKPKVNFQAEQPAEETKKNLYSSQFQLKSKKLRTEIDVKQFEQKKKKTRKGSMQPPEKFMTVNILDKLEQSEVDFAEPIAEEVDNKALNFLQPWTNEEIEKTYNTVVSANAIATLQFKPQNPNPIINIYLRKHLNSATINSPKQLLLPIQEIINTSFEEEQLTSIQPESPIGFIRKLMFSHLIARIASGDLISDLSHRMLKFLQKLELKLQKIIGYNIVLTEKYLMVVPLISHYEIYNGEKLYLDGLASIGVVHIPKLNSPFMIQKRELKSPHEYMKVSAGQLDDIEDLIES